MAATELPPAGGGEFPATGRDAFLCGLLCDLVAADPGRAADAYLDALVLAAGYRRHGRRFLVGGDRAEFVGLCDRTPLAPGNSLERVPWAELTRLLTLRGAVAPCGRAIHAGPDLPRVRGEYPVAAPRLVALVRTAADYLRELQGLEG